MRHTLALAAVASLFLFACGGTANTEGAKSADDAVWSTFSGKYSAPADKSQPREGLTAKKEAAPAEPPVKAKEAPPPAPEAVAPAAPAKKSSKATVQGESISSITVDGLTDALTALPKSKLVSNGVVTGVQYEVVTVQTKKATIKITRPATTPNATGPELTAPKDKVADLSATDAYWYDADADVLVVVSAKKKSTATKTMNAVVKR